VVLALATLAATASAQAVTRGAPSRFEVVVPASTRPGALTGRLVLVVSRTQTPEPRLQVSPQGPAIFGVDLDRLAAGRPAVVDAQSVGFPVSLATLPAGDYYVQAVVNVYEQVKRSDGHSIWVHMNDGTPETFNVAAGNLYSDVQRVRVGDGGTVRLAVTRVIPPSPRDEDTEWVKHVRIQSEKLTRFWGRPVYVNATVLLPKGYAEHPTTHYPSVYALGHAVPFSFTTTCTGDVAESRLDPVRGVESGCAFGRAWLSDGFPRMIAISLEQQTPYFPDSYSVNSANNGPYGDAIVQEVMPQLEARFRIIRKPYARLLEGASTSGWQTLALTLRNPDLFGGSWILQPDPIDFQRYQQVDIYKDTSAFVLPNSQLTTAERPFKRTVEGQPVWSVRGLSRFEEVLGTRGRSGYQLEGWEAVYGPTDADGYPKPLWNKLTGTIDRDVANYMRENGYDLRDYAERNWQTLGPKLVGKLHFFAGDMDDFYLNLAVYRFQDFLKRTTNPHYEAEFSYGRPMKGHSWHAFPWAEMVRQMAAHVRRRAPVGEDAGAWSY
jgi:hypothetical protein